MSESIKTIVFVGAAIALAGLATASHYSNQPTNSADFELVGKPFWEDFNSASQASSLEVAAVDADTGQVQRFKVAKQDGLWRIPTPYYNYPAEAAVRLAETGASVMGINRESLAGRLASEHERLGVIDPLGDEVDDPEAIGQRITLKDDDGDVVVDLIIGHEVEDDPAEARNVAFEKVQTKPKKTYYVRRPDEQQTYKVKLDIDLSTKFSDWIEPDLLQVTAGDLTKIEIDNYKLAPATTGPPPRALVKSQGEQANLMREKSTGPWQLEGTNSATEEVAVDRVKEIVSVLDELKIVGVRPKFKFKGHLLLTADLKVNQVKEFNEDPLGFRAAVQQLQRELEQKGFSLAGNARAMELVSTKGDLTVGTRQGVVYKLHIGEPVNGSAKEIEVGGAKSTESEETAAKDSAQKTDDNTKSEKDKDDSDAANRYLMVRVSFDKNLVSSRPTDPVPPIKPPAPEGYQPPSPKEPKKAPAGVEAPADVQAPDDERKPEFIAYDRAVKLFEQKQSEFELAKVKYESDMKEFQVRVEKGRKLVDQLNERFGDWYYVVSGSNLKTLQTKRSALVKIKEPLNHL